MPGGVQGQNYQVQNAQVDSFYKNNVTFSWENPTDSFTSLQLNYSVVDSQITNSVQLANTANTYTISSLSPGSEIDVTISTLLNGQIVASVQVVGYTGNKFMVQAFKI